MHINWSLKENVEQSTTFELPILAARCIGISPNSSSWRKAASKEGS